MTGYELDRLARAVAEDKVKPRDALELAYALGAEVERLDAKQRACSEYDRARTAREAAREHGGLVPMTRRERQWFLAVSGPAGGS